MENTLSTNFKDDSAEKINEVLDFVLNNPYSSFYRKKYKNKSATKIASYDDFMKIPLLSKDEFINLDIDQITFVPQSEIKFYAASGGTTTGIPTIIPHANYYFDQLARNYFNEETFLRLGVKNIMTLLLPNSGPLLRVMRMPKKHTVLIPGDIENFALSADMAKEVSVQGIITSPSRLNTFIPYLEQIDYDFNQIKWISLGHEFFPASQLKKFKRKMPNAFFNIHYGASEIGGGRGYRCEHLAKLESPQIFHPTPSLIEIVDKAGNILPFASVGEIVHTDLTEKAFPVIRYKMGDIGMLEKIICPCGNNLRLTLEGRHMVDFVEIKKNILSSQMINDALIAVEKHTDSRFQMHVFTKNCAGIEKIQLELHLKLNKSSQHQIKNLEFHNMLAEKISENLILKPNTSLKDLITNNDFLPLMITFVDAWHSSSNKAKHIILHS